MSGRLLSIGAVVVLAGLALALFDAQSRDDDINDRLGNEIRAYRSNIIEIAPMIATGEAKPGAWTKVDGGIFDALLERIGIKPGVTDAEDLQGKDGFLEFVSDSGVVTDGATRATFGYFIRAKEGSDPRRTVEYFALFSYDWLKAEEPLFATEFFLFGPVRVTGCNEDGELLRRAVVNEVANPPLLRMGVAIGANGKLLPAVPLSLARVSKFKGEKGHENEPVKPGVSTNGAGCLVCHSRSEGMPQDTGPFPWTRVGKKARSGELDACLSAHSWKSERVTDLAGHMVGGADFHVVFFSDGTQSVVYDEGKIFRGGKDTTTFSGRADARMTTQDGVATIESVSSACVNVRIKVGEQLIFDERLPSLGLGLGTTAKDNGYVCTKDSLEYKASVAVDGHPTHSVKLKPMW